MPNNYKVINKSWKPEAPSIALRAARWFLSKELKEHQRRLDVLEFTVRSMSEAIERDRSKIELGAKFWHDLQTARETAEYRASFTESEPLVTVVVATFNRSKLLVERALASLTNQTYQNLQILVIGDCCTDDTAARISELGDSRIEFINLTQRGAYPEDPYRRWMVAGSPAMNEGLKRARGRWITHLDDDDRHAPHRIEKLLRHAQSADKEILWHPFRFQNSKGEWQTNHAEDFVHTKVSTSSVFYHSWFARILWDVEAHLTLEAGDWNRFRKFVWLDAKRERFDEILLDHYKERQNS